MTEIQVEDTTADQAGGCGRCGPQDQASEQAQAEAPATEKGCGCCVDS